MTKECPKCGKEYSDEDNFCESCGKKLVEFKEKSKEIKAKSVSTKPKKWFIPVVVLIIVAIAIGGGVFWFYGGVSFGVTCNKPYIKVGSECCLDQNENKICDSDETTTTTQLTTVKTVDCSVASLEFGDPSKGISGFSYIFNNGFVDAIISNNGQEDLSGLRITTYGRDGSVKSCNAEPSTIRKGESITIRNAEGEPCAASEDISKIEVTTTDCPGVKAIYEREEHVKDVSDSPCHFEGYIDEKWCEGKDLYREICRNGKWVAEKVETCPKECVDTYSSAYCK